MIRRDGVQAASVRAVAAEAGWSPGSLRHYFNTQSELLRFAIELILERVPQRLRDRLDDANLDPPDRAQAIMEELLPLDDERNVEMLVWLAFTDRARVDQTLTSIRQQAWDGTRYLCRLVVADLRGVPRPELLVDPLPDPDDESRAERLHALVDGLSLQGITYPDRMPPDRLRAVLADHLHDLAAADRR